MLRKQILIAALLAAPAAFALNNRSAVSVTGLDTNPCTTTSPCRSFAAAMTATVADGEIIALTSGGYGPFAINQGVTVSGVPGVHAAITVSTGDGIDVSPASAVNITIRNLVIIGTAGAANGIRINNPCNVRVIGCVVRNFPGQGIEIFQGALSVDRTDVLADSNGIDVSNSNPGFGTVHATITNSLVQDCPVPVFVGEDTNTVISGTTVALNTDGIHVEPMNAGAFTATLVLEKSIIANNVNFGVLMNPGGNNTAVLYLSDTLFEAVHTPISVNPGSTIYTFGNNEFKHNNSAPPAMTSIALK